MLPTPVPSVVPLWPVSMPYVSTPRERDYLLINVLHWNSVKRVLPLKIIDLWSYDVHTWKRTPHKDSDFHKFLTSHNWLGTFFFFEKSWNVIYFSAEPWNWQVIWQNKLLQVKQPKYIWMHEDFLIWRVFITDCTFWMFDFFWFFSSPLIKCSWFPRGTFATAVLLALSNWENRSWARVLVLPVNRPL